MPCAWKSWCVQLLSRNSSTLTLPSDEAQASRQPLSCGAHDTTLTDAVCSEKSKTLLHELPETVGAPEDCSRQIRTLPS